MKKSLSLLVAAAMTLTTASVAFAADAAPTTPTTPATPDLTAQQKFDALKELGIFNGYPDGSAGLDKQMTRAEFAKVLTKLTQLEENAAAAKVYTDVPATHWAAGFIGASTEAKLMNGLGANKFGPSGQVTVEQIAKVADLVAGIEPSTDAVTGKVSEWAKGYVAAAVKAGLLPELPSYQTNATRQLLVEVTYDLAGTTVKVASTKILDEKTVEVTFSDGGVVKKTLDTALVDGVATKFSVEYQGKSYEVSVTLAAAKIAKAEQTNAREITVSFDRALTATEKAALTFEVKNLVPYGVTPTWSTDNSSVALVSAYLPAGEYDVTVKGFDAVKVKVADEVPTKIEVTTPSIQKADNQDFGVKLFNQFGKEVANASLNVTVYNATQGKTIDKDENGNYDLKDDAKAKIDDNIVITASHSSGLTTSKTFKVVAGSAATAIKLGTVAPLKDKTRITAGDAGLVLPIELTDQYGQKIKLNTQTQTVAANQSVVIVDGINLILSETGVIKSVSVDKDGVLTFDTAKASNLVINAVNPSTGATASISVKIEGAATVAKFNLSPPTKMVAANEEVVIPFVAIDNFNGAIAGKDIKLGDGTNGTVKLTASGAEFATGYPRINGKGELVVKFVASNQDNYAYIYAYTTGYGQVGMLQQLQVKATATPKAINGVTGVAKNFTVGATSDLNKDNITYVDNYSRTFNVAEGDYQVDITGDAVTYADGKLTAAKEGTAKVSISLKNVNNDTPYVYEVNVVATDKVTSYAFDSIGTVYGNDKNTVGEAHTKEVKLVGKLSNGESVALVQAIAFNNVTTSNPAVLSVDGKKIFGIAEGKATITAYNGATKVAEQEITVSTAKPVATTVAFSDSEYTVVKGANLVLPVNGETPKITVKDQYGTVIDVAGFLASGDTKVVTVNGSTIHAVEVGQATVTYITSNNVIATAVVTVNAPAV